MTQRRPVAQRGVVALLAAIAYLPALLSSPGRMPTDTKLYLYLDPGRLMTGASKTWDTSLYGGWVPHQMIAYLWPSGPWFWLSEQLGLPDWVAHRLWIATILFLGGLGVWKLARAMALPLLGAAIAALVYQLSPYILPYISRTSVMLLPWMALGWLMLLTMRAVHHGGWRTPALIALVVCTVSSVNATAFAAILPGPVLWLLFEWRSGRVDRRQVLRGATRIAGLSVAASLWWVAMLSIQNRYGADVLAYSESLESVSWTTTGTEVVRGLGYWLFYLRDPYAAATTSAIPYQESPWLIVVGYLLLALCLLGLVITRFRQRGLAIALVLTGLVLSVGVHPFTDPAPLPSLIRDTGLGLALRSSTRALPLLSLGLALGAASLVVAVRRHRPRHGFLAACLVVALVALNLPSLWTARLVDPALARDQDPPSAWIDAAHALDEQGLDSRVLQIPGADFGAFRWGYTVDQPLSGLTERDVLTRDLIPLGSPQLMDLLYALDNRMQNGVLDPAWIAPVARLLAVDTLWVSNDLAFDRFRTPRPEVFADLFTDPADGLGTAVPYGEAAVNQPDVQMVDEQSLSDPRIGTALAPVLLVPVDDPTKLIRIGGRLVVIDGSGDGVVNAAAAGLLHGDEVLRYAADLSAAEWADVPAGTVVIITDSNRDRDTRWNRSQDTQGMTERGGPGSDGVRSDGSAQRLPLFDVATVGSNTTATLDNGLVAEATAYGEKYTFLPEYRAAMAVDGDPSTAWRLLWEPEGEALTLTGAHTTHLQLLQAQGAQLVNMITSVDIDVDGRHQHVALDETSLVGQGQSVSIPEGNRVRITIASVGRRPHAPPTGEIWVGFAEVGPTAQEWVRPPTTALDNLRPDATVALVFQRDRIRPTNRWRSDPEPRLARVIDLRDPIAGTFDVTLRLSARADDAALDALAGLSDGATSNRRLTGVPAARASAAFDDDMATAWTSPFDTAIGSIITVPLQPATKVSSFRLHQPPSDTLSTITAVRVTLGDATSTDLVVPPAGPDGYSTIDFPAASGDHIEIEITAIAARTVTDRLHGDQRTLPVAISDVQGLPTSATQATVTGSECRDDLLTLDGKPLGLQIDAAALLAGEAVHATPCDGSVLRLSAGEHRLLGTPGARTAIDLDEVTMLSDDAARPVTAAPAPAVQVESSSSTSATLIVPPCPDGCWLIFGQGRNDGWSATADGDALPASVPVSGGANGWFLPSSTTATRVSITFTPQRTLDIALGLSAAAVGGCLVLAAWPLIRRRRSISATAPVATQPSGDGPMLIVPWLASSRRAARGAAALLVVGCLAFVGVWWAVGSLAVAAVLVRGRRLRLAGIATVLGVTTLGLLVAAVQLLHPFPGDSGWPRHFERLHSSVMFLMLLLGVSLLAGDDEPDATND